MLFPELAVANRITIDAPADRLAPSGGKLLRY